VITTPRAISMLRPAWAAALTMRSVTAPRSTRWAVTTAALVAAYSQIIPSKDTLVIVHCRTGHQASQTYFVLKRLLGYTNVRWYDAGWTEWAARRELPIVNETQDAKSKQ